MKLGAVDAPGTSGHLEVWYTFNPVAGAHPVKISASPGGCISGGSMSYANVDQRAPALRTNSAPLMTRSIIALHNTTASQMLVDNVLDLEQGVHSVGSGQTQRYIDSATYLGGSDKLGGSSNPYLSWNLRQTSDWAESVVVLNPVGYTPPPPSPTPTLQSNVLPGETFWPNGVSKYIFGTNDTGEWTFPNIEFTNASTAPGTPNTVVQNAVKNAGFTLLRTFVPHHDFATSKEMTDAEIAARLNTAANTGMQCLVNLISDYPDPSSQKAGDKYTDLQFAKHVLTLADGHHQGYAKCSMFEIGNEFNDLNGHTFTMSQYLNNWNIFVSTLKQIRPDAKFIGPVNGARDVQSFLQGIVLNNYPLPDAISWHWYPCGFGTLTGWSNCPLSLTNQILSDAQTVRGDLQSILGYQLPIGISEWSDDPSMWSSMTLTEPKMSQFIAAVLNTMVQAKLDFANEFDIQSGAAFGSLDMFDQTNKPRPYFYAFSNSIAQYRQGTSPTSAPAPTTSTTTNTSTSTPASTITCSCERTQSFAILRRRASPKNP
jgi:hypothetical protein